MSIETKLSEILLVTENYSKDAEEPVTQGYYRGYRDGLKRAIDTIQAASAESDRLGQAPLFAYVPPARKFEYTVVSIEAMTTVEELGMLGWHVLFPIYGNNLLMEREVR